MNEVQEYYDSIAEREWKRLERHRVEFDITKRYLSEYIDKNSKILDVGGGPGRYSIYLKEQGHLVSLLDLSYENIKLAKIKAEERKLKIDQYIHANALNLSERVTSKFDVVLCMGPLYHLIKEEDRVKVIAECMKKLKKGGRLFVSFISAYAPIIDFIKNCPEKIIGEKDRLLNYISDGKSINGEEEPGFTTAYFINPKEIESFMTQFGLKKEAIAGLEGLTAQSEDEINSLSIEAY